MTLGNASIDCRAMRNAHRIHRYPNFAAIPASAFIALSPTSALGAGDIIFTISPYFLKTEKYFLGVAHQKSSSVHFKTVRAVV